MTLRRCLDRLAVLLLCLFSTLTFGQAPDSQPGPATVLTVPAEAQPSPNFNAERATEAYLAEMPSTARARSDAYFEGGYWMILWDFLYGVAVALVLLNFRWSAKMSRSGGAYNAIQAPADPDLLGRVSFDHHDFGFSVDGLRRLLPRTQVRTGHANLRPVDGRSVEKPGSKSSARSDPHCAALRDRARLAKHLVDMGIGCHSIVPYICQSDHSGLPCAHLQ